MATKTAPIAAVYRIRGQSYSCIYLSEDSQHVHYIPLSSLTLEKATRAAFHREWEAFTVYPVRRAAELYLGAGEWREITPQVRALLQAIVADDATKYDTARIFTTEDSQMATTKTPTAPVKTAPVKTAPVKTAPVTSAPAKTTPAKTTPAKTTNPSAAAVASVKAGLLAGLKAPGKTAPPASKTAPSAAPAKKAGPSAKTAPANAKTAASAGTDTKYKLADPDRVFRGDVALNMAVAKKLGTFTRAQFIAAVSKSGSDKARASEDGKEGRLVLADALYRKLIVEA